MAREHLLRPIQNSAGDLLANSVVRLIDPVTGSNITAPIYAGEDDVDPIGNPYTTPDGMIDIYVDQPMRVRIGITPSLATEEIFIQNVDIGDSEPSKETFPFTVSGAQAVKQYGPRFYVDDDYVILSVRVSVGTAPTGADLVVDVNKNGTSIFASTAAQPRIAAGAFSGSVSPSGLTLSSGDYLTIDVDQVGSTVAGSDLTVQIRVQVA